MEEISGMLKIDRESIYLWRKRKEETESIKPFQAIKKGRSHKIKDSDSFVKFLDENQDIKLSSVGRCTVEDTDNILKQQKM
jgi:transposase